jgi:fibronectin-binding autotransporter adhesin
VPTLAINGGTVTNADPAATNGNNNALGNVTLANGTLNATVGSHSGYGAWDINGTVTSSGSSFITSSDTTYGTVVLSSAGPGLTPAYTTFHVTDGTLAISAPLAQCTGSGDARISGLIKTGAGTLTLNGAAVNTFTGGLKVNGGALVLDYTNLGAPTDLVNSGNAVTLGGGGALTITGKNAAGTTSQTFAGTTLNAGMNNLNIAKGASATSATLNLGALTINPGGATTINPGTIWATGTPSTTEKVYITSYNGNPLPGSGKVNVNAGLFYRQSASAGAARWVSVDSAGQLQALPVSIAVLAPTTADPTAAYQISSGNITLTNTAASSHGLVLNPSANGRILTLAANGTYTINGILGLQASNTTTINAGTGTSNIVIGSEKNLVINMDNGGGTNGGNVTISAPIANNGSTGGTGGTASSVTIASTIPSGTPGDVKFTGANTYSGTTYVTRGRLLISNAGALGTTDAGTVVASGGTLGYSASSGSVLTVSGESLSLSGTGSTGTNGALYVGGSSTLAWGGPITLTGDTKIHADGGSSFTFNGAATIDLGSYSLTFDAGNGANSTFAGDISGVGGISKTLGTTVVLNLNGNNSYSGPTTISAGTLSLGHVNALGNTSAITIAGGATLSTATNGISINAPIALGTTGTTSSVAFGLASASVGTINLNGVISGAGNLTFTTPNNNSGNNLQTIFLGSAGTYGGDTLITTGNINNTLTVKAGVADTLPATTVLTLNGGNGTGTGRTVAYDLNGHDQTLAGLTNVTGLALRNQRIFNNSATPATLTINNTANYAFSGNLGSSTANGNFGLTKSGAGTFTISGTNSYTGPTVVSAGILSLGNGKSMQNSALDTLSSVAGDASNGLQITVTALTVGGLAGNKDLADVFTTTSGGYDAVTDLTLNPGSGVTNSYTGSIADGAAGMNLIKTGAGTQALSGASAYTGATTIRAGTLKLDFSAAGAAAGNIIPASSPLSMGGGTLALQGNASTTNSQQFNGLSLTGGVNSIELTADPTDNPLLLTLGDITRAVGSTVDFTLPAGTQSAANGITTTTANAYGNILGAWATVGGTAWASNNGTNIVALSSYTLTSVAGTAAGNYTDKDMEVDNSAGLLDGVITTSSLRFNTAGATEVTLAAGNNVISSGGILVNSAVGDNLSAITGGTLQGAAGAELFIIQNNTANSLVISSEIADNGGATGLIKAGAGALVLSGANTYSGVTKVGAGILSLGNSLALQNSTLDTAGSVTGDAANGLQTTVTALTIGGLAGSKNLASVFTTTSGGYGTVTALTLNPGIGAAPSYSGIIADGNTGMTLTKTGAGTQTLAGVNTYTGATTISEGTLQIGGAGSLGGGTYAGDISIAGGAALQYSSTAAQTLSGVITGAGSISKDTGSSTTLTLSNDLNDFAGGITISAGRVSVSAAEPLSTGTITCIGDSSEGGQLFVSGTPTITNNFVISGVGYPDSQAAGPDTGRGGAIRAANGQTFTGTITLAGDSRIGFISGSASVTLSGRITGPYAMDFYGGINATSATHTFILANTGPASDYTGDTSITSIDYSTARTGSRAILQLGADNQIPNGAGKGILVFKGANTNHQTILELNGFNETINGLSNVAAAGAIIRNTSDGASTLTIGDAGATSEFSGVITDGGSGKTLAITKIGAGTLTLSGENSYTGDTKIEAGTLSITSAYLADLADVYLTTGAHFNLDFTGTDKIDELYIDGAVQHVGTWGAPSSGATYISSLFSGTGWLDVTTGLTTLPGDTNSDNVVDAADFITLKKNFGTTTGAGAAAGDFNDSGSVNWADLGILTSNIGTGGGAPAMTPEPCSALLLVFGAAAVIRRRGIIGRTGR